MTTTIKISQLPNIGNVAGNTLLPVVSNTGTLLTNKATVQQVGNFILSQAGNSLPQAAISTLAQTVTNAAQPNITSVGVLTNLTTSGNVVALNVNGGNLVTANYLHGTLTTANQPYVTELGNLVSLTVQGPANLGPVGNLTIQGGSAGEVLTTDGAGNLSWAAVSGNGTYGNSNVAAYLPTYTGNVGAGNVNVTGGVYTSNLSATGFASLTTVNVSATTNLGAVGNVTITGGTNGQVLQTNGNGVLSWASVTSANANYANFANIAELSNNILVEAVNNNFSYHVVLTTGPGDTTLHNDIDDSFQYNPADGILTVTRVDTEYLQVSQSVISNLVPFDSLPLNLGSNTNRWQDLYLSNSTIYLGEATISANGNSVVFSGDVQTDGNITANANSNIVISTTDGNTNYNWTFDTNGKLTFPGNPRIDTADNNFEVQNANAVNFEAASVVNIYTDTGNAAYQWQFGDDGNLTLPLGNPSINYANGTPYGGGGSGYIIPYEVAAFEANTAPSFGEIQFANNEGSNSSPATAQKLFINESPTNEQSMGTIFQQWTSNSYRGTLSLNNGNDSQATFNISNGGIYFEPEVYRGFQAGLNQIWGDDCSVNQLIITNATAPNFYNTEFLVEGDVFHASGLATGNTHVMLNVYGSSEFEPINPQYLWNLFTSFVNNVLYDGATLRTDTNDIRTQFYLNAGNFRGEIPPQDYYQWFNFANGTEYFNSASTTGGSGTGATVRVRVNADNTYTVLGTANPGTGYIGGETLTVAGTDLGGASPANDLTVFIDSVDGDGVITQVSYDSGTGVYSWPSNSISDGSDDQYDTGNYINTNLETDISYANGIAQTSVAAFGGGDYCVMYNQSIFCMVATGTDSSMSELYYSGDLGSDGDGWVRWTGLRSSQAVTPNNQARYAYFDCEYLDGELTPTVGTTYNMNLDSAGINLDEYYAYFNNNNNDYYFGSNNTWRLESQEQLFVQSYDTMYIQTMTPQRGPGLTGPNIIIDPADGCDAVAETNAPAQQGGSLYLRGGAGGSTDGVPVLGASGGFVDIVGGLGTGNAQAGNVNIYGGEGAVAGSINLYTDFGANSSGKVKINTYDGNTNKIWEFRPDGNLILPGNGYITNPPNSSLDPINPNVSTMIFTPDPGYSSQSLVLDPTAPGHIHLRAPGANIDEPLANIFLGGEDSSFEVGYYNGSAPNVFIHSGGNTWEFLNDGNLVFPRDAAGNTDPFLRITGGASPRILSEDVSLAGPANLEITALNTIFTGSSGSAIKIYADDGEIGSTGNLELWANAGSNVAQYNWTFDTTGNLTTPSNLVIGPTGLGTGTGFTQSDAPLLLGSSEANGRASIIWYENPTGPGNVVQVGLNDSTPGSMTVLTGDFANTTYVWDFDNTGNLTLPTGGNLIVSGSIVGSGASPAPTLSGFSSVSALQFTNGNSNVTINANSNTWTFDSTGNLIIPGASGGLIKTVANASIGIAAVDNGTNNPAQLLSMTNAGAATSIVSAYATNATIQTNATGSINTWAFDSTGNLTLPGNTFAVNYANGTQVSLGGGVAEASFSIQSSNFNATAGSRYGVNTSGGAVTATLPASPATGAAIFFADAGGAYASNNLTIARNGQTIMGAASDLTVSTNNQSVGLFFNGTTWRTYNAG